MDAKKILSVSLKIMRFFQYFLYHLTRFLVLLLPNFNKIKTVQLFLK